MADDPLDLVGDTLEGQIRIDEFVGEGDLTFVYRGHHLGLDAPVAVKLLCVPQTLDPCFFEAIESSFRAAGRLHYRLAQESLHIAQSLASGTTVAPRTGQSAPYIIREWLDGHPLSAELERRRAEPKPRLLEIVQLFVSGAEALAVAHEHDVAHLAIHPANLFVAKGPRGPKVKILDFGFGALDERTAPGWNRNAAERRAHALRLMMPGYAAPEQIDPSLGASGPASDVYSFAMVMIEALSNAPLPASPANGRSDDVAGPILQTLGLSPRIEAVLRKATARAPSARQKDMRAFWRDLIEGERWPEADLSAHAAKPPPLPARKPLVVPRPTPSVAPPRNQAPAVDAARVEVAAESILVPEDDSLSPLVAAPHAASPLDPSTPIALVRDDELSIPLVTSLRPRIDRRWLVRAAIAAPTLAAAAAIVFAVGRSPAPSATPGVHAIARGAAAAPPIALERPSATGAPTSPAIAAPTTAGPAPLSRYNTRVLRKALDDVAAKLETCREPRGPRGAGSIHLEFDLDGNVTVAFVGPPYRNTPEGRCIVERFSTVHLQPYAAPQARVNYNYRLNW